MTKLDNLKNLLIIAHDENVLQLVINGKPIACDLWQDEQDNYFINLSVNCYNVVNNGINCRYFYFYFMPLYCRSQHKK